MNGILLDNWTLEKIVKCINDETQPFSPEVIAFIEVLVLWDNIYYFENGYTTYWQEHSVIEGFNIAKILKPIPIENVGIRLQQAETEYYKSFCNNYTSLIAKGALEYMYIASSVGLNYMPFGLRSKFIKENNLFSEFKQYYDRYDAIHAIDKDVLEYYNNLNTSIRKADISFNPNILFYAINRKSNSFSQMIETAMKWSNDATIMEFKNWCSRLEEDISNYKTLKIQRYENELKQIEQDILNKLRKYKYSFSVGIPFSISLAINLPMVSSDAHLLFPMSLYLDAIGDNAIFDNNKAVSINS